MNSNAYRNILICDTINSATPGLRCLRSMETATLPNGLHAYVITNRTMYVLDKLSTDAATGGIVAAVNGGRWIPVESVGDNAGALHINNLADKTATLTGTSNYTPLNAAANSFGSQYTGTAWELNTTTGVATWRGLSTPMSASVQVSMYNGTTVIDTFMALFAGPGGTPKAVSRVTSPVAAGASSFYTLSLNVIWTMDQDDTLQLQFAGDSSNLTVVSMDISLIALS